jgi:hypothetical protein
MHHKAAAEAHLARLQEEKANLPKIVEKGQRDAASTGKQQPQGSAVRDQDAKGSGTERVPPAR